MEDKTNVMRILDQKKIEYKERTYLNTGAIGGQEVAEALGEDAKSIENCGIDFNGNKDKNFKSDIIKKCQDAGLELGAWTINEEDALQKLEQYGITLITTDCIEYAK